MRKEEISLTSPAQILVPYALLLLVTSIGVGVVCRNLHASTGGYSCTSQCRVVQYECTYFTDGGGYSSMWQYNPAIASILLTWNSSDGYIPCTKGPGDAEWQTVDGSDTCPCGCAGPCASKPQENNNSLDTPSSPVDPYYQECTQSE
jgi:hypothetical protein